MGHKEVQIAHVGNLTSRPPCRGFATLDLHTWGGGEMEGKSTKATEAPDADGLDLADAGRASSLDLVIPIIKQSISLLRRLRERADAARQPAADDHTKSHSAVGDVGGASTKKLRRVLLRLHPMKRLAPPTRCPANRRVDVTAPATCETPERTETEDPKDRAHRPLAVLAVRAAVEMKRRRDERRDDWGL
jgi:hypothetical protein